MYISISIWQIQDIQDYTFKAIQWVPVFFQAWVYDIFFSSKLDLYFISSLFITH